MMAAAAMRQTQLAHTDPDARLLSAVAAGDQAAFRELHARHHAFVFRIAVAVLLDAAEARDVVQEVFVRLHRAAPTWRPDAPLSSWLRRVAVNESLSVRRRLKGFFRSEAGDEAVASAERGLAVLQTAAALRAAMLTLSPRQRAVVTLHVDHDLQPTEFAALLGLTPNTARVTLHQALTQLRAFAVKAGLEFPEEFPVEGE
jgi:RNA polymerase sigma-70 factor (ECF subfamily)